MGDCDTDNDCKGSLKCFRRGDVNILVPGCRKPGISNVNDYCYDPNELSGRKICEDAANLYFGSSSQWTTTAIENTTFPYGCFVTPSQLRFMNMVKGEPEPECNAANVCVCSKICEPGTYQDQKYQKDYCKMCPAGQYQKDAGKRRCEKCEGFVSNQQTHCNGSRRLSKAKWTDVFTVLSKTSWKDFFTNDGHFILSTNWQLQHHAWKNTSSVRQLESAQSAQPAATKRNIPDITQYIIYVIILLWLFDLFKLRQMLDTTILTFQVTENYVELDLWGKNWECFLNDEKEAEQALLLLDQFTSAYQKPRHPTYKQIMAIQAEQDKQGTRQRRRSSKSSREMMMTLNVDSSSATTHKNRRPSRRASKSSRELINEFKTD